MTVCEEFLLAIILKEKLFHWQKTVSDSNDIRAHTRRLLRERSSLIFRQTILKSLDSLWNSYVTCNNIQSNTPYREALTTQFSHLVSLAKWLGVCVRTKWLWVRISLLLLKLQIWRLLRTRRSLTFRQTIECRFTLKLVGGMKITCS